MTKRIYIFDFYKLFFAYAIIALHTISSIGPGYFIKLLCRIGVPIFSLLNGFFLAPKLTSHNKENSKHIFSYCLRLLLIDMLWSIPFLVIDFSMYYVDGSWIKTIYNIVVAFWKRGIGAHLWFLSALALCILFLYYSIPLLSNRIILIVCSLFYLFCLLGDNYYGLIKGTLLGKIIDIYILHFGHVWNSFMSIILFVFIGHLLFEKWKRNSLPNISFVYIMILLIIFFLENIILKSASVSLDNSASIILIPLSVSIVIFGLRHAQRYSYFPLPNNFSMYLYLSHMLVIRILDKILGEYNSLFFYSILRFIFVAFITSIVAFSLCLITKNKK